MVAEKFQIYSVKITENTFVNQKMLPFTHAPKQNSAPGLYHYSSSRREFHIPPEQRFLTIFFPEQKEGAAEDYGVQKITKINNGIGHKF